VLFKRESNVRIAYEDLLSGRSMQYNQALKKRYSYIQNSEEENIKVEKLDNTPTSIFFTDIGTDSTHWKNREYAIFYGKKSIIIK